MAVYVDELDDYANEQIKAAARKHGTVWCHMVADTRAELDGMARAIGLKTAYRQHSDHPFEHYDLTPRKRALAVSKGARQVTNRDLGRIWADKVEAKHKEGDRDQPDQFQLPAIY